MALRTSRRATSDGARPQALGVRPQTPRRPGLRRSQLLLGALLVVGFGLAGLVLLTEGRDREPMLVLASDLRRGDVIAEDDLRTVDVDAASPLDHMNPVEADALVGRAAVTDLSAGAVVTEDQFSDPAEVLGPGEATVGLALGQGQLPSPRLAPGDRVMAVAVASGGGSPAASVDEAQVVSVERIEDTAGPTGGWWVSLRASRDDARALAESAAAEARVHLVLLGDG